MKIHAIISFLCLASVALGTSCKDDETHFLQRSHDALSFPYLNSTKELLVLTNGSWKITPDDTWISCSPGEGNGAPKEQAVNITVAQNDGAERTGSVTLSDGLKELVIRVLHRRLARDRPQFRPLRGARGQAGDDPLPEIEARL